MLMEKKWKPLLIFLIIQQVFIIYPLCLTVVTFMLGNLK